MHRLTTEDIKGVQRRIAVPKEARVQAKFYLSGALADRIDLSARTAGRTMSGLMETMLDDLLPSIHDLENSADFGAQQKD